MQDTSFVNYPGNHIPAFLFRDAPSPSLDNFRISRNTKAIADTVESNKNTYDNILASNEHNKELDREKSS